MTKSIFSLTLFLVVLLSCENEDRPNIPNNSESRISKVIYDYHDNTYSYDTLGRLVNITTRFNQDTINVFSLSYYYNQNGQLAQIESKNKTEEIYLYNYTYTDSSIIELIFEKQAESWKQAYKNEYVVNDNGKCLKKIVFETDLRTPSFYYQYSWSGGNIIKEEEISFNSGLMYTKTYEYDDMQNPFQYAYLNHTITPYFQNKNNPLSYQKTSVWNDNYQEAIYSYDLNDYGLISFVKFTNEYGETSSYKIEYED